VTSEFRRVIRSFAKAGVRIRVAVERVAKFFSSLRHSDPKLARGGYTVLSRDDERAASSMLPAVAETTPADATELRGPERSCGRRAAEAR